MNKFNTHVYELPECMEARGKFLDGIQALMAEHGVEMAASSHYDEMTYAEKLEEELEEHLGSHAKEGLRNAYEREARG